MSEAPPDPEAERLRAELQAARAAFGDFSYAVSHDLRANLRHILSYAALLREEAGDALADEAAGYLETISSAARLLGGQIDGLMAWTQLDRAELHESELDAGALIKEARAQLAPDYVGRQIDWQVAERMPALRGDGVLLRQLFVHLLSNALKFSRPRLTAVIQVGWEPAGDSGQDEGRVRLFVRDNGVGFDPARQDRLFHVFQRLHSASQFEGLGLGLALSRKIVERHGGRITAEAAPEAGCRVSFSLPAA